MATDLKSQMLTGIHIFRSIIDMTTKFTYDDTVKVVSNAFKALRPGTTAWIVGVFDERPGSYFERFPTGTVYSIVFEDGSSLEIHESDLESADKVEALILIALKTGQVRANAFQYSVAAVVA